MDSTSRPRRSPASVHFALERGCTFLNHGSFGATPHAVLAAQQELRLRMERQPVRFLARELEPLLDATRERLAKWLGARPADLVFVPNATAGVNAVLQSLPLAQGEGVLTTDHVYNACGNVLRAVCERAGAEVQWATLPFPVAHEEELLEAVLRAVKPNTRYALLDHVTSPTALVLPVAKLARALRERGVETLVDGAHAPGMLELDVPSVGAAFYTGNCHKWIMAPKGAGFLWVREDWQRAVRPALLSHGANSPRTDRSRLLLEFDWTGTSDPTAVLSIGAALDFGEALLPGGWPALRAHNHALAVRARELLCEELGVLAPAPASLLGSMASVSLPPGGRAALWGFHGDALAQALWERFGIEVPVMPFPAPPARLLRVSAQIYNAEEEYRFLGGAVRALLADASLSS